MSRLATIVKQVLSTSNPVQVTGSDPGNTDKIAETSDIIMTCNLSGCLNMALVCHTRYNIVTFGICHLHLYLHLFQSKMPIPIHPECQTNG